MKFLLKSSLLIFSLFLFIYSCSKDSLIPDAPTPTITYTLTATAAEGGTVNTSGGTYQSGDSVQVTATPNDEYVFSGWSNGSTDNPLIVVVSSNQTLSANFIKATYSLTTTTEGEGTITETIVSSGKSTDYNSGSLVRLTAVPSSGWGFNGWTGDYVGVENPIQLTVDEAKTLEAVFGLIYTQYTLTVTEGEGGTLSTEGGTYDEGTEITITATANVGYIFVGWSGYEDVESETISIILNSNIEIIPVFANILDSREIIVKRVENQSSCQNGGFSLLIGWDYRVNESSLGIIDEIIQEINFCNISDDYLTFENIVSEYIRIPEIVWKNNQLHLQKGLSTSNYKTPIVSYLGPNTNPAYSDDLIDYDNGMAFWYRFEKLNTFHSFKFNFQDRALAKTKILTSIPNYEGGEWDSEILSQNNCSNESCFGGANANVTSDKNGYTALRIKTPETYDLLYFSGAVQVHEFTHSIHLQYGYNSGETVYYNDYNQNEYPCWLTEGTAHYSGLSIGLKTFNDYITERTRQMSGRTVAGLNPNNANDLINQFFNVSNYDSGCSFDGIYELSYSVGLAVVEALSTISGPDSIMMVWKLVGKYGYSFEESFELVYGISWNNAVPILAEVVSKYSY